MFPISIAVLLVLLFICHINNRAHAEFKFERVPTSCGKDCEQGACRYTDCTAEQQPKCLGGACEFIRCVEPTCNGGACDFGKFKRLYLYTVHYLIHIGQHW